MLLSVETVIKMNISLIHLVNLWNCKKMLLVYVVAVILLFQWGGCPFSINL